MKKNVKRIIALCICCALLAAAVIQNVYSNKKRADNNTAGAVSTEGSQDTLANSDGEKAPTGTEGGEDGEDTALATGIKCDNVEDYLAGLRLERDKVRSATAEECMAVIESESAKDDEKTKAQETVQSIGAMQEIEGSIETALKSKGYEDVFVTYATEGSVDVTLVAKILHEDEVMAIAGIISESTGITLDCMSLQSIYQ